MAIRGSDGSIVLTTSVDQSGLKKGLGSVKQMGATIGKSFLAIGAAAATATVAITKMATSAYADYEQLVGGVETLFKGSADKVKAYAENAFFTAGKSANEYMDLTVTFANSLIQGLGGDTERAADLANTAIVDMSDNVNRLGSDAQMVEYAYRGLARQEYRMLDNLKLGYQGTAAEMARLVNDSKVMGEGFVATAENVRSISFDKYIEAIHEIQVQLGIAGTTSYEATATIQGSAKMMKSAWQNALTAISGGGDMDRAINNLVYSIQKYFENIVPVVERALQGVGTLIEKAAPLLVQTVARALIKAIPSLLNAVYQMIISLAKGIYEGIVALFSGGAQKVMEQQTQEISKSVDSQNELTEAVKETEKAQKGALAGFDQINTLAGSAADEEAAVTPTVDSGGLVSSLSSATTEAEGQADGFVQRILKTLEPLTTALGNLFEPIKKSFNKIDWEGMAGRFREWSNNFSASTIEAAAKGVDSLRVSFENLEEPLANLWNNALRPIVEDFGGWIISVVEQTGESFAYFSEKITEHKDEITSVINGIGEVISLIWAIVGPIIDSVVQGIFPVLQTTIDFIFSIIQTLANFFDFFKNFFAGAKALLQGNVEESDKYLRKALGNFVNIFVGIGNGLIAVINNLWTLIFDAFKGTVNSITGLVSKVGEWLGFDWDLKWDAKAPLIPEIPKYVPKLAQGAVIPPNREFLAVLGDQKRGTNIEAPLDTIKQAVAEVIAQINTGNRGFNGRIEVPVVINGREVARAVRDAEESMGSQTVFGGFANAY